MSSACAEQEEEAGHYHLRGRSKLWACEPARWKWQGSRRSWYWLDPPEILFQEEAPTCDRCSCKVTWTGPPQRRAGFFVYEVICRCVEERSAEGVPLRYVVDKIVSDFPLRMGGTATWWREAMGVEV